MCFGRRPIDFVGENDVRENGTRQKLELSLSCALILLKDFGAGNVGGHQVGCELNPIKRQAHRLGQRADHQSFCQTGNTDKQCVSSRQDRNE